MFNSRRPKYHFNRALPSLDFLKIPRTASWIGFELYKYIQRKPNDQSINKGQWIVVREAFLHLNPN